MIRQLSETDFQTIYAIVNDAAVAYKGKIPADCWREPYMPKEELRQEINSGVQFYGYIQNGKVVVVMGIQRVGDITLVRHAYTLTSCQRQGLGEKLLKHLLSLVETDLVLVGTWEAASWAIRFYQKNGFKLLCRKETNKQLKTYWNIPERQIETSVVLKQKRQPK
ncbi:MAG: GNAT family N-acetyltransferase [Candidatus Bathyarchaeia archaeon]|jgi:GNAT superfamily N-acetyltransferase